MLLLFTTWNATIDHLAVHLATPGICEICGQVISDEDIEAFQAEANDGDDERAAALPCCCEDCAAIDMRRPEPDYDDAPVGRCV